MLELENFLAGYLQTKNEYKLVPGQNVTVALRALRERLPRIFREMIESGGYDENAFYVKGSVGEPNRSFAKVPWVAIFDKKICRSATKGYYIVLLFAEDMSSVTLSLNQGYTAFEKRYVYPKLAYKKLRDCSRAVLPLLAPLPPGFNAGPIDLKTSGTLAKGYEAGAILSKTYLAKATPSLTQLQADVIELLRGYEVLATRFTSSLIDFDVEVSDQQLLEAALNIRVTDVGFPKTTGPQPPPPLGCVRNIVKHVRAVGIVANALAKANSACALETSSEPHLSFTSAKTKKNYVEAHHLVPFSQQPHFQVSLDVEDNIVVLCPNCHRMLHHGTQASKVVHLRLLFRQRESALKGRGINVSLDQLLEMYKTLDVDD